MVVSTVSPRGQQPWAFACRRFFRIFPLYWGILGVFLLFMNTGTALTIGKSFLLIPLSPTPAPTFGYSLLRTAWTLSYEVVFYCVFLLALWVSPRRRVEICSAILLFTTTIGQLFLHQTIAFAVNNGPSGVTIPCAGATVSVFANILANPIMLEFVLGMIIGLLYLRPDCHFSHAPGLMFAISILCFLAALGAPSISGNGFTGGGIPSAILLAALLNFEKVSGFSSPGWCNYLGDTSYGLYLTHIPVATFLHVYYKHIPFYAVFQGVPRVLGMLAIALILCHLGHIFIELPGIQLGRKIGDKLGGRNMNELDSK